MIIEGDVSVKASLLGKKRITNIVYIDQKRHDKNAHFVEEKCKEYLVPVERVSRDYIDNLATGHTHGGMISEVTERKFDSLNDILKKENPFLALVEGVEDPFNLGYIMRSLYSAGCDGLLLKKRNWKKNEATILKSSAGAFEYLSTILSENLEKDISLCKERGIKCYAAMRKDAKEYYKADFRQSILVMIGGEMRGLSSKVLALADENIYIPYANDFRNALNAAGATAVLGFEVMRQRKGE